MNYNLTQTKELNYTDIDSNFGIVNDITKQLIRDISKKRDDQILEALKKRGHTFQNKQQLYEFAKRCEIRTFIDRPNEKELWYEDELICLWSEKMTFKHDYNDQTFSHAITVNIG